MSYKSVRVVNKVALISFSLYMIFACLIVILMIGKFCLAEEYGKAIFTLIIACIYLAFSVYYMFSALDENKEKWK